MVEPEAPSRLLVVAASSPQAPKRYTDHKQWEIAEGENEKSSLLKMELWRAIPLVLGGWPRGITGQATRSRWLAERREQLEY
jgi:hypothetical protein